ncbi:MAG: hypothetical protein CMJ32_10785 [Phycisphaerae bacterium]|nr:hypothetical protein [Phycisphaerae bacterium]
MSDSSASLPVISLPLKQQHYSCHACGNCCRDFTVQLNKDDLEKISGQDWVSRIGQEVTTVFRGVHYLRQKEDGACIFWMDDGRCRIHAEHGYEAKPIACQLFPFALVPEDGRIQSGISFACQSVLENKGDTMSSHLSELRRMVRSVPDCQGGAPLPYIENRTRAQPRELKSLRGQLDRWMAQSAHPLHTRLDGLAWFASSLGRAKIHRVRDNRFDELLELLFGVLPGELELLPIDDASARQASMMRQAAFARIEDPKFNTAIARGRLRTTFDQLMRSRRFAKGSGAIPIQAVDWPTVHFDQVDKVRSLGDSSDAESIDELMTRYIRATVLGNRAWGAGYYGWPVDRGLQALVLNVAVTGWLARVHAAAHGREEVLLEDARAALGRVDRTSGRARWLGSSAERLRAQYLQEDDGFRRIVSLNYLPSD